MEPTHTATFSLFNHMRQVHFRIGGETVEDLLNNLERFGLAAEGMGYTEIADDTVRKTTPVGGYVMGWTKGVRIGDSRQKVAWLYSSHPALKKRITGCTIYPEGWAELPFPIDGEAKMWDQGGFPDKDEAIAGGFLVTVPDGIFVITTPKMKNGQPVMSQGGQEWTVAGYIGGKRQPLAPDAPITGDVKFGQEENAKIGEALGNLEGLLLETLQPEGDEDFRRAMRWMLERYKRGQRKAKINVSALNDWSDLRLGDIQNMADALRKYGAAFKADFEKEITGEAF